MKLLLFLGPGKTGSTFIYEYLQNHPALCASYVKETGYFLNPKGLYNKFYKKIDENTEYCYEVSNVYFKSLEAIENIDNSGYEDIALVIAERDPVGRAFSHVRFLIRNGEDASDPEALLDAHPEVIESSRYKHYSKLWSEKHGKQLHFIKYKSDPEEFGNEINVLLNKLGLDSVDAKPSLVNQSMASRNKILTRYGKKLAVFLRNVGLLRVLQWCKDSSIVKKIFFDKGVSVSVDKGIYEKAIRARLVALGEIDAK